jgi:hypothetical protein
VARAFSAEHPSFSPVTEPLSALLPPPDHDAVLRIGAWLTTSEETSAPDAYQLVLWRRLG